MKTLKSASIDEYISHFPRHIQTILQEVRAVIKQTAPAAEETRK
jgi:uncharacterized protein YdhG (YjbR/CyaY superfamily)